MDKVLMIADDLTGALDAGIGFAAAGIPTCVGQGDYFLHSEEAKDCCVQVSVVPSRHMTAADAYSSVYDVVKKASQCGFTCIFKKTDSALRGNVGAELEAVLAGSGEDTLYFIPALPRMKRITRGGIQYIDGTIPVAESVFHTDPFNPVCHSAVAEVIGETSEVYVYPAAPGGKTHSGVAVFDAETDADVLEASRFAIREKGARLVAGCAGLAAVLPGVLELACSEGGEMITAERLITFCGSINPVSLRQCAEAEKLGAPRFHLIDGNGFADEQEIAQKMIKASADQPIVVFDTGSDDVDTSSMDAAQSGRYIAQKVSRVIRTVTEQVTDAAMFVIGGDTLIAFIDSLGIETIIPVKELFPGVVLAKYKVQGKWQYLISKSGGFGEPDLLQSISLKLSSPGAQAANGGV